LRVAKGCRRPRGGSGAIHPESRRTAPPSFDHPQHQEAELLWRPEVRSPLPARRRFSADRRFSNPTTHHDRSPRPGGA